MQAATKSSGSQKGKLVPAKVTSKIDSHRPSSVPSGGSVRTPRPSSSGGSRPGDPGVNGVAPPMSSIVVERHQPVSKVNNGRLKITVAMSFTVVEKHQPVSKIKKLVD